MTAPMSAFVRIDGLDMSNAHAAAVEATNRARFLAPKLSGASAARLYPIYGSGYFGIGWRDRHIWFQEQGIRPFTMRALAGKVIPMWIDDPRGDEHRKNPQAKVRTTESGKTQVLIFRRAAVIGARKRIVHRGQVREVPASYPGAPGRIAIREASHLNTTPGRVAGRIAAGNVGVRWRHPGLSPRSFIHQGILSAGVLLGVSIQPSQIEAV